ncbi:MAG: ketoacyl-ACP synthase III [Deltaproteobacteria bacterium]|nr:ketoacyl-ACP synthase III [Deltaproteobacteria bacterium]
MRSVSVRSTGCFVPPREITNDALRARWAASAPEFVDKQQAASGITTRWAAPEDWATSDLCVPAAQQALERAGISAMDLDLIVLGTDSPDYITPSTSVVLQRKLGALNAGTFDVGCACASFPTALATAAGLMATQPHLRRVLVVAAYMMRKLSDPMDTMSFFYGDGAGAAVLEPSDVPGVLTAAFLADGNYAQAWGIYAGGTAEPATPENIAAGRTQVRLVGKYPPEVNENGWPTLAKRLATQGGFALADVDCWIFTQVRKRTIEKVMAGLALPIERAHMVMQKWGYTGSACIPMALHDAIAQQKVGPGSLVALIGSGVGYNQAAVALRLTDRLVSHDG